jgi:hypothetical protein
MNKDKLLTVLYSIYKIIDAVMLAVFFALTFYYLQAVLVIIYECGGSVIDVERETVHTLGYIYIYIYGNIVKWIIGTRIAEATIRAMKLLIDICKTK